MSNIEKPTDSVLIDDGAGCLASNAVKALVEVIPAGVAIADAYGNVILSNKAVSSILGSAIEENILETGPNFVLLKCDGTEFQRHELPFRRALEKGEIVKDMELRVKCADGFYKSILCSSSPITGPRGEKTGAILIFQDITSIKNIQERLSQDEDTIKAFFNAINEAMYLTDTDCNIVALNDAGAERFRKTPEELTGKNIFDLMSPGVAAARRSRVNQVIDSRKPLCFEDKREGMDQQNTVYPVLDDEGNVSRLAIFSQDVTERKKMLEALRESEERFRSAFDNAATGMSIASLGGVFLEVNKALCDLTGYTEEELCNMSFHEITHPDDLDKDLNLVKQLLSGEIKYFHLEKRYYHKNSQIIWVMLSVSLVRDSMGRPLYFLGQVQDITESKRVMEELQRAREQAEIYARTDYLTGILNRRAFLARMNSELDRAKREGTSIGLLLVDVDYFKKINDTYGHMAGDLVLQEFSSCIASHCRPYDFVGRYGGEEFIICLPNTGCEQAEIVAERMRTAVEDLSIQLPDGGENINITASFGVARTISGSDSIDTIISQADSAMYRAKNSGKNRVCVACD